VSDCTVYIDESGDLGVNKGTRWFVLSAVVVDREKEPVIREKMKKIRKRLNLHEIHMRKIKDFNKQAYIVHELSEEEFVYMNVLVDTSKFDTSKIPTTIIAYNYICKYLLQRVSWYLHDTHQVGDIVLSARSTERDGELIQYICEKLLPYPSNSIDETVFGKVCAKQAAEWDLLQLADVCATTMFWSYNENDYGLCRPCFSLALRDHLYKKNKKVNSYGIKFFQSDMQPNVEELRKKRFCAKKERTPGATTT